MNDPAVAEPGAPDDFWWYVVTTPNGHVHLYEVGHTVVRQRRDEETGREWTEHLSLSEDRQAEIHEELGIPANMWETGWDAVLAPGRPNRWLEPKAWDGEGNLGPIRPKPGATYHPLPGRGDPVEG